MAPIMNLVKSSLVEMQREGGPAATLYSRLHAVLDTLDVNCAGDSAGFKSSLAQCWRYRFTPETTDSFWELPSCLDAAAGVLRENIENLQAPPGVALLRLSAWVAQIPDHHAPDPHPRGEVAACCFRKYFLRQIYPRRPQKEQGHGSRIINPQQKRPRDNH